MKYSEKRLPVYPWTQKYACHHYI